MADITDAQIDAALARGAAAHDREPRAKSAHYDKAGGRIVVELTNGAAFAFPIRLAPELKAATAEHLTQVAVSGSGYGLHWEMLDVDLSVPGLLAGLFGTRAHLARKAGQATSPSKADAARRNGALGGRPRSTRTA